MVDKRSEHKAHTHHEHRETDLYEQAPELVKQHSHPKEPGVSDFTKKYDDKREITPKPKSKMH